jgi:alkyldihydroxyacetonephosphate synthase
LSASEVAEEIEKLLGDGVVLRDRSTYRDFATDWSPAALLRERSGNDTGTPLLVVRPRSVDEVSSLLEWAQRTGAAIVPAGGRSGVVEGIRAEGLIVLDTSGLDAIGAIDEKSRLITVGAGVTGPGLRVHLEKHGWFLGHEPQSVEISTVGGWVATKACGQLSARYGGIEDLVAGLTAVLPGGRVVHSKAVPRRSAGPDVAALMLGSEGTLGVVTEVVLRITPVPGDRVDRCVRFEHMTDGVAACRMIVQSDDLHPTLVRLYDPEDAMIFLRNHPEEPQGPLLLLSFSGHDAEGRASRAVVASKGTAGNHALVEHWWIHRNDAVAEFRRILTGESVLGEHGIVETMEVSASWSNLRDVYHSMKKNLGEHADIVGCHVSHVYRDGACLYLTMGAACASDEEAEKKLDTWWEQGMRSCLDAGGSISHHHGIGRRKVRWFEEELGGWYDVLTAVKRGIDPKRIMNPGALGL